MLKKSLRMGRKSLNVFFHSKTRFYKGNILSLRVRKEGSSPAKLAFIVSSSIKRNAIARNTTRRRINEIARAHYPAICSGIRLVFFITLEKRAAHSFRLLKSDMITLLQKAGALCSTP